MAKGVSFWGENDPGFIFEKLAERLDIKIDQICLRFGRLELREGASWFYNKNLGVYSSLEQ
jgi:hypothetical protein